MRALIVLISALYFVLPADSFAGTYASAQLARALYQEQDWDGAWVEALRAQSTDTAKTEALVIYHLSSLQREFDQPEIRQDSSDLLRSLEDRELGAWGEFQLGRIYWSNDEPCAALYWLQRAYADSPNPELFAQTAYSLWVLLIRNPALMEEGHPLRQQLRTSRRLFTPAIRETAAPPPPASSVPAFLSVPAIGLVRFYQTQIGPAIGQRCSMYPSCSEYCLQATRRYGLMGIPMTADRLIRETDHVNHRIRPILINGEVKYYNPIEDHSFWFRRYNR